MNFLFNIVFWILLFLFVLAVRYYEIGKIAFAQSEVVIPNIKIYGNAIVLGVLIGIPYSIMEYMMKNENLYKHSLVRIILNRTIVQYVITGIVLTLVASLNFYQDIINGVIQIYRVSITDYIFSATVKFLFIAALVGNVILTIFRTLQLKIGEDIFFELLTGKYSPAQEEDRAFLFIDLKSSTTIAEQLGHVKYSHFIQDCFKDLHPSVVKTKAMVYQYVGDEAVLTWNTKNALHNNNCIHAFFLFSNQLESRRDYYMKKYGQQPFFKAGLNLGKVMTAEVGVIKREIAFHSDVLNTAARIQALCNEKNAALLASEAIVKNLSSSDQLQIIEKGAVSLRGKNISVNIFEISQPHLSN